MAAPLTRLLDHLRRTTAAPMQDSDAVLLERFARQGEEAAFRALVERHGPMVLNVCRRVLGDIHAAEDAFQATFLVLMRKAGAIGRAEALAGWLHGVACRVAFKARTTRLRRRDGRSLAEAAEPTDPHPDPLADVSARDLLAVLEAEVQRLPRAYRLPVVLCCLEGLTQEEAAGRLGWTAGAVKGRLERGRKRLHDRLSKRGLTLSAALAAVETAHGLAPAGVPPPLLATTVEAGRRWTVGAGMSEVLSPRVIALGEGVLRAMMFTKVRTIATALLAVALVTSAVALVASSEPEARPIPTPEKAAPAARPPRPEKRDEDKAPASYVRVEVKGKLVRNGARYHVEATDAIFPHTSVTVILQRGEDKNRSLDTHLQALEGKAVVAMGFLDCRRLQEEKSTLVLYLREEKQVRPAASAEAGGKTFEDVRLAAAEPPQLSLLYVVLTTPRGNLDRRSELVVQYAAAALREAEKYKFKGATLPEGQLPRYEGNIVFFLRDRKDAARGAETGFSVEQLREMIESKPERARQLAARHAWSFGKLPSTK